jgi:hypothetical protein
MTRGRTKFLPLGIPYFRSALSADDAFSGPPPRALGGGAIAAATIACTPGIGITGVELRHQTDMLTGTAALCFFADIHHVSSPQKGNLRCRPHRSDRTHDHITINRHSCRTERYGSTAAATILDRSIAGVHVFPRIIHRITAAQIGVSLRVRWVQDTLSFVFFFIHGSVFPFKDFRLLKGGLKNEHQAVSKACAFLGCRACSAR